MCKSCKKEGPKFLMLGNKQACPECVLKDSDRVFKDRFEWLSRMAKNMPDSLGAIYKGYPYDILDAPVCCASCGLYVDVGIKFERSSYCLICAFKYKPEETKKVYDRILAAEAKAKTVHP